MPKGGRGMTKAGAEIGDTSIDSTASAAALLAIVNAAGASFERLVFTRNRRVLVSVGDRGRTLRLHAFFADAPGEVIAAIGRMYMRPSAGERRTARSAIRGFVESRRSELPDTRPGTRKRRIPPADREHIARLAAEFERVNREHFAGELPTIPIFLSGRMRRRNGHFSARPLEIVVSRRLCASAAPGEAEQTLRHEMVHLWQHVSGAAVDHGREFRRWAERLEVHPRAKRIVRYGG